MINKKEVKRKHYINAEKYILIVLVVFYTAGICCGCHYYYNSADAEFIKYLSVHTNIEGILYFLVALALKYSGVLNGLIYTLPLLTGIKNAVSRCVMYSNSSVFNYSLFAGVIKDSALVMLLILYIIVLISQILNKRFDIKKDVKYLSVYMCGTFIVVLFDLIFTKIIFQAF